MIRLLRARQKEMDDLPAWSKCCSRMVERLGQTAHKEFTAKLSAFEAEATCPYCGRVAPDVLYRKTVGPVRTVIAIDVYEWDEGFLAQRDKE